MTSSSLEKHTVSSYDQELNQIIINIKEMRKLVIEMLDITANSFSTHDTILIQKSDEIDQRVNILDDEINRIATNILALRQPMAIDLRFVTSALKIATILERMGDMAKNSTSRMVSLKSHIPEKIKKYFQEMLELVEKMVKNSVKGFGKFDVERADKVWKREEKVDELGEHIFDEIQTTMQSDVKTIPTCMKLLLVMKNIERIGDYATNVTKLVHYVSSGDRDVYISAETSDENS